MLRITQQNAGTNVPQDDPDYWYDHRSELEPGMVFRLEDGDLVKLDTRVPGDGTKWRVALWLGDHWSYEDGTIEPGELRGEALPDPARK